MKLLHSLTARGRAAATAGLVLFAVGYGLGDRDFARLSLLLLVIPVLAAITVRRTRTRLSSARWLTSARVPAGETVEVRVRVSNLSRIPSGVLLAEDTVPSAFGSRPRFVVNRMPGGSKVDVHYAVRCHLRGRYRIGPLTLRMRDPFGLAEQMRGFDDVDEIVVTPAVHPLPLVRLTGEWAGLGESTRRSVATAGEDDTAIREYRLGDDLRRVHWRSTARLGELMVRREEQPWQSRAALLLDTRANAHAGEGRNSSLEWAISAIASVGAHLDQLGFQLRLVFDSGLTVSGAHGSQRFVDLMLDCLATCTPSRAGGLSPGLATLRHGGGEGLIVAVIGAADVSDVESMIRVCGPGVTGIAIMVDAATWGHRGPGRASIQQTAALLTSAGWRVVIAGAGSDVADLWRRAGNASESYAFASAGVAAGRGDLTGARPNNGRAGA